MPCAQLISRAVSTRDRRGQVPAAGTRLKAHCSAVLADRRAAAVAEPNATTRTRPASQRRSRVERSVYVSRLRISASGPTRLREPGTSSDRPALYVHDTHDYRVG